MKKIITGFLALSLAFGAVHAQSSDNKVEKHHHKRGHEMPYKKLDLSSDQKATMKQIRAEFHKKFSELKKQDGLTKDQIKEGRMKLKLQQREKMESVLTGEQKSKLAELKKEWKAKHEEKNAKSGRNLHFKELNLTAEQKQKIEAIRSEFRASKESIKKDQALSSDDKKVKMKELDSKRKDQVRSVLTPEQQAKLETMKKEHRDKDSK